MDYEFEFIEEVVVTEHSTTNGATRPNTTRQRSSSISLQMELWHTEAAHIRVKYPTGTLTPDQLTEYAREFNTLNQTIQELTPYREPLVLLDKSPVGAVLRTLPGYNGR